MAAVPGEMERLKSDMADYCPKASPTPTPTKIVTSTPSPTATSTPSVVSPVEERTENQAVKTVSTTKPNFFSYIWRWLIGLFGK